MYPLNVVMRQLFMRVGLFDTDRGVSPVIATILMVAITVILSAVIGTFVLDIGGGLSDRAPQAQFSVEQENRTQQDIWGGEAEVRGLTVVHEGGEPIDESNIRLTIDGERAFAQYYNPGFETVIMPAWSGLPDKPDTPISAGDSVEVVASEDRLTYEEVVRKNNYIGWTPGGRTPKYNYQGGNQIDMAGYGYQDVGNKPGELLRVIWESESSDRSAILLTYEIK